MLNKKITKHIIISSLALIFNANCFSQDIKPNSNEITLEKQSSANTEVEEVLFEQPLIPTDTFNYWGQTTKIDKIQTLLEHGANPNTDLFFGNTLLLNSAMKKNIEIFDLAIQYKANIKQKNNNGDNILHIALANYNQKFFDHLKTTLSTKDIKDLLLAKNKYGATPIHSYFTNLSINIETFQWLTHNGSLINEKDKNGLTPGHYLALSAQCNGMNSWLKNGGKISEKNNDNDTVENLMLSKCEISKIMENQTYLSSETKDKLALNPYLKSKKYVCNLIITEDKKGNIINESCS